MSFFDDVDKFDIMVFVGIVGIIIGLKGIP
jgi:hypothetical protein